MNAGHSLVCVVDDDESVRESLPDLLRELGFTVEVFASASELLVANAAERASCLILDVTMPKMSGPELHRELLRRGIDVPVIFITARPDENVRDGVLAQGAVACLFKPFSEAALLEALDAAQIAD